MESIKSTLQNIYLQNKFYRVQPKINFLEAEKLFYYIAQAKTNNNYNYNLVRDKIKHLIAWTIATPLLDDQGYSIDKGWLFIGGTGTGKTKTAEILKTLFELINLYVVTGEKVKTIFNRETRTDQQIIEKSKIPLTNMLIYDARDIVSQYTKDGQNAIDQFIKYGCLCIDDMGTEEEGNFYGTKKNVIAEIINGREKIHRITFATTNNPDILEKYDDRTASRMASLFNVLTFDGISDFRLMK